MNLKPDAANYLLGTYFDLVLKAWIDDKLEAVELVRNVQIGVGNME